MRRYLIVLFAVAIFSSLGFAANASAATRYASPSGTGDWQLCLEDDPCSLTEALAYPATDGDDVILSAGNFPVNSMLYIDKAIHLKGAGAATTTITSAPGSGPAINTSSPDVSISDMRIVGQTVDFTLMMVGGTVRRTIVTSTGWTACRSQDNAVLFADTVCATSAKDAAGMYLLSADSSTQQIKLRGVTAVNTDPTGGYGVMVSGYQDGSATLDAKSVIASGATSDLDVWSGSNPTSTVTATLDHSIFDTVGEYEHTTVTAPGSGTNKTGLAGFNDPANFDFSLQLESPGINTGDVDDLSSDKDVVGNRRVQGGKADIGAFERDLLGPDPPLFTSPTAGAVLSALPTIAGTAEPNASLSVMLDGLYGVASSVDESGNWDIGKMMLEPGVHTIVAKAGDAEHNWSDETSVTFTLLPSESTGPGENGPGQTWQDAPPPFIPGSDTDATSPIVKLAKKPKAKTTSKKFKLAFSSNEAGSTFKCKLDSGAYKPCASSYKKTVKVGRHKLLIIATDASGNQSAVLTVKWKVVKR
jgi:hypothetical protein